MSKPFCLKIHLAFDNFGCPLLHSIQLYIILLKMCQPDLQTIYVQTTGLYRGIIILAISFLILFLTTSSKEFTVFIAVVCYKLC